MRLLDGWRRVELYIQTDDLSAISNWKVHSVTVLNIVGVQLLFYRKHLANRDLIIWGVSMR